MAFILSAAIEEFLTSGEPGGELVELGEPEAAILEGDSFAAAVKGGEAGRPFMWEGKDLFACAVRDSRARF